MSISESHLLPVGEEDFNLWTALMKARITVTLKTGVLDPQGKAIEGALRSIGIDGVGSVRQGKVFDITLAETIDAATAERLLEQSCQKLLANTVVENYHIEVFGS